MEAAAGAAGAGRELAPWPSRIARPRTGLGEHIGPAQDARDISAGERQ